MGHGMASNLRRKLPAESVLWIYDINTAAVERFVSEFGNASNVQGATSPRQIYENAVCRLAVPDRASTDCDRRTSS